MSQVYTVPEIFLSDFSNTCKDTGEMTKNQKLYYIKYVKLHSECRKVIERINTNAEKSQFENKNKTGIDVIDDLKQSIKKIQDRRTEDKLLLKKSTAKDKTNSKSQDYENEIKYFNIMEKERKRSLQDIKQTAIEIGGVATDKTIQNIINNLEILFLEVVNEFNDNDIHEYPPEDTDANEDNYRYEYAEKNFKEIQKSLEKLQTILRINGALKNAKLGTDISKFNILLNIEINKYKKNIFTLIKQNLKKSDHIWKILIKFNQSKKINSQRKKLISKVEMLCKEFNVHSSIKKLIKKGVLVKWYFLVAEDKKISQYILSCIPSEDEDEIQSFQRILLAIYCVMLCGDRVYLLFKRLIISIGSKDMHEDPKVPKSRKFNPNPQ